MKTILLTLLLLAPVSVSGQQFYYHTVNTSSLSASWGNTFKGHFSRQLGHRKQLKLTGSYIFDAYDQGTNRIKADIYNVNLQLQHNLIYLKRLFVNVNLGIGAYDLEAWDKLDIRVRERRVNFVTGLQVELYIASNRIALVGDFDMLLMPFSDLYDFIGTPSGGIAWYF